MVISIIILSIVILFQFITNWKILRDNIKLRKKIDSLESEIEDYAEIIPGDKVSFKMSLTYADKHNFDVIYESEVLEVSDKKIKIKAYEATEDSTGRKFPDISKKDPNFKNSLLAFMKDKWVDRKDIMPIIDMGVVRNRRIEKLLK